MKMKTIVLTVAVLALCTGLAVAQEMTKEEWQQQMNQFTQQRNELQKKLSDLNAQITTLEGQSSKLDDDYNKCLDELYALVGSNRAAADAYRAEIEAAEEKADDLARLSDADLMARSNEVDALDAKVKSLWENKLSLIPEFWDRLTALNEKIKSLKATLAGSGQVYTVGTWARDRDCLWNISKKKAIYGNAWLWPKIWQGNRDQIKDPDIIEPGQKLKIPAKADLNAEEKAAARRYYSRKAGH